MYIKPIWTDDHDNDNGNNSDDVYLNEDRNYGDHDDDGTDNDEDDDANEERIRSIWKKEELMSRHI